MNKDDEQYCMTATEVHLRTAMMGDSEKSPRDIAESLRRKGLVIAELGEAPHYNPMSNTAVLCFVLGYQGGTVHQVARELDCKVDDILNADLTGMGELCRRAQQVQWKRGGVNALILKHLGVCIDVLVREYDGHDIPPWLERARGVHRIIAECYPQQPKEQATG